jgi:hypothetical protein
MKIGYLFILAVILCIALVFSCSSDIAPLPPPPSVDELSSSSATASSSSLVALNSSSAGSSSSSTAVTSSSSTMASSSSSNTAVTSSSSAVSSSSSLATSSSSSLPSVGNSSSSLSGGGSDDEAIYCSGATKIITITGSNGSTPAETKDAVCFKKIGNVAGWSASEAGGRTCKVNGNGNYGGGMNFSGQAVSAINGYVYINCSAGSVEWFLISIW